MNDEGPLLESLTHRLAECPPEFLLAPIGAGASAGGAGEIDVFAIVCDHLRAMDVVPPGGTEGAAFRRAGAANRQKLVAVATWMLHDEWFLARPQLGAAMWPLLKGGLDALAEIVRAEDAVADADRREELARLCLARLGLRPRGETVAHATDRLTTLDSVERVRVVSQTRGAEARARELRRKMAEEAARAAAARYAPE